MPPPDPGELFERYHLALFRYIWRTTGRRDVGEDLTQEVFIRVLRGTDRYEGRGQEKAWLFRIARNLVIDRFRRDARGMAERTAKALQAGDATRGAVQELGAQLQESLGNLDALDRDVFLLREVGGLGYAEIGAVCDLTNDAVRSRICRARSALRQALGSRTQVLRV